jgi:DNA modification methylase
MDYQEFLTSKAVRAQAIGINVTSDQINPKLFDFQRDITLWALRKGRALVGLDTGLGKTFIQLEWARLIARRSLIIAPLSVARQTQREARKLGLQVKYVRHAGEVDGDGIYITNYEMAEQLDAAAFGAVVLDESSILKSIEGKTRRKLTIQFGEVPYRLCCTATPAPNDNAEIGMHSEYLGVMRHNEMLASFFIHANKVLEDMVELEDGRLVKVKSKQSGKLGQDWRIRNYAKGEFYRWMASWAMMLSTPSDLGYDDNGYLLPPLRIEPVFVDVDYTPDNQLFFTGLKGIQDRTNVRRSTLSDRIAFTAELVNNSDEQWIVWCGLQQEADAMMEVINGATEARGGDNPEERAKILEDFQDGKYRVLVTKPKVAGFGMNFQNAHNMVFVGLGDSWEAYYQCIRREWRFGQTQPVNVYIVLSEIERGIYDNVMRKEAMAAEMKRELIANMQIVEKEEIMTDAIEIKDEYQETEHAGENWRALLGDSTKRLGELSDDSIDMSVYSPPFADLYTYSNSSRDLGNSHNWDEFFTHYKFILTELYRIHKPGTVTCVHTADIPALSMKDGYIGLKDFPGEVIKAHQSAGWVYHGWAVVAKNPQAQAIRTKAKALLFVQLKKDSSHSRPAILDRVLFFKKPGERDNPVTPVERGEINNEQWIDWAGGLWTGISESDTLQYTTARAPDDEKHICPLQLGTIERCVKLYSNPGELVLTPFLGIGSEAYTALKFGRKAIGIELKSSYYNIAVKNLENISQQVKHVDLFSLIEGEVG